MTDSKCSTAEEFMVYFIRPRLLSLSKTATQHYNSASNQCVKVMDNDYLQCTFTQHCKQITKNTF